MKELQHEFHSGSDGFPCFDFPRLLLQEVFPLEWRRNRLKHSLAQKKKSFGSVRYIIIFWVISYPLPVVHM